MSQLALFEEAKPVVRLSGGPPDVQRRMQLAFSEPVKAQLVTRLNERIGQWLSWKDFADIRERHQIGFCMGHVLASLARDGRALVKDIYFGAERPGDPFKPYLGFTSVWSSVEHGPAPEQQPRRKR